MMQCSNLVGFMKTLLGALGLVFLAEFGDKSQLVALSLGARYRMRTVFLGMGIAYSLINLLSVTVGAAIGNVASGRWVRGIGGLLFLAFAIRGFMNDNDGNGDGNDGDDSGTDGSRQSSKRLGGSVVASIALSIFVAEFGDKTMISAAALAAQGNAVLVWVGATIGIMLSSAVGVLVGRFVGNRIPTRIIRLASSGVFATFGVVMLVAAF
jgi:Ca2+/H+ antiporter, TMEM165/GDT1 family